MSSGGSLTKTVDYRRSEFAPLEFFLSRRARRTTPHPGKGIFIDRFSEQHPEYKKLPDFPPVYGEPFGAPAVDEDDALYECTDLYSRFNGLNILQEPAPGH